MIVKYLGFAVLILLFITASDSQFGHELTWEKIPDKEKLEDVKEFPWMSTDSFRPFLEDEDDRVSDKFPVTPYFYPTVHFWFLIYTQFESNQVVIHDKTNLNLIYKVLDFSSLHHKGLNRNMLYILQQKLSEERIDKIRYDLKDLAKDPYSLKADAKVIYRSLKEAGIQLPIKKQERISFFNKLKDNIRTQTGQRNFIKDGIIRSLPYKPFLNKYFPHRDLPVELLAIPFLESSFNPLAESKVGALGPWQFMPLIASYYVPKKTTQIDYRSNIGVISIAAANLMKENIYLMKSWDMAVTAYNSGTKHLLKTRRELASQNRTNIDLEDVIKHSDSNHFGFASKNFYSEFLALVHALAYEEEIFAGLHREDRYNVEEVLDFYLAKCSMRLDKILNAKQQDEVRYHNHQLEDLKSTIPRGAIITTKDSLPSSKFYKLSFKQLLETKPKDWTKYLGNQSCSTK